MTPLFIWEFLIPWAWVLVAYPVLARALWVVGRSGPRIATASLTRRPLTGRDVKSVAGMAIACWVLAVHIGGLTPVPQWWSQQLTGGWEISFGFAMVIAVAAVPMLYTAAVLLTGVGLLALAAGLNELGDRLEAGRVGGGGDGGRIAASWSAIAGRLRPGRTPEKVGGFAAHQRDPGLRGDGRHDSGANPDGRPIVLVQDEFNEFVTRLQDRPAASPGEFDDLDRLLKLARSCRIQVGVGMTRPAVPGPGSR